MSLARILQSVSAGHLQSVVSGDPLQMWPWCVCVVVPWNQKHSTHALRNGENRVDQLSLCCLVRGKHLSGGSALGTNVKMPFSFRVMANIV